MKPRISLGIASCTLLLGVGLLSAADGWAQGLSGSGALRGRGTLAVQRCGQTHLRTQAAFVVAADGSWNALTEEGATFTGTWMTAGTNGRQLDLSFDANSESGFVSSLAGDASELCGTSVQVTSALKKKFLLKLNRRGSRAKVVLRYTGTGIGGGRSGWARSGLTLSGRWTAS